jgi:hypothetical protein
MPKTQRILLLPAPRYLKPGKGFFLLPRQRPLSAIQVVRTPAAPAKAEGYSLTIDRKGVRMEFREAGGLRAATATLRQLLRTHGRRLPFLRIRDWPDFARRGVMLDISRGRVPTLATLLDLAEHLADFKINELQLYTEHTFAYRKYPQIWRNWGALTAAEIKTLDARCRELGIDLVPNQNSFGHLRYFLADPKLRKLAEISQPYPDSSGEFVRRPTTLAPNHPGTLPFLRGLYDDLLPNFSSSFFNIGADETWDLGRGQSKAACARRGQGRVYVDFLKRLHREVSRRGKQTMFWGDIILKYPDLIRQLPQPMIALNWGYEATHPFAAEAGRFARAKVPFYVCPGTSTWQTLIGKNDNAFANLSAAARAGKKSGAIGYLNTDWGDGGHPQPLAVSWPLFVAGAALAWNANGYDPDALAPVLSRDVFEDPTGRLAKAVLALGLAHLKLGVSAPNETPLGTVIAAPEPDTRELFCRNGLKWHTRIPAQNINAALSEIERQRRVISHAKPASAGGKVLGRELDLAARMAAESCHYMLWQQAVASGKKAEAAQRSRRGIQALKRLDLDFGAYWPRRNKATPRHCTPFLNWRIKDYQGGS